MDTKLAINILENTFKQKFDIERFEYFLTELFNEVEINTVEEKHFVKNTYKKYVNHLYNITARNLRFFRIFSHFYYFFSTYFSLI